MILRRQPIAWICGLLGLLAGCAPEKTSRSSPTASRKQPMHRHGKGPHQGIVFDLGKYHAEFVHRPEAAQADLYMLDDDEESPLAVAVGELLLTIQAVKDAAGKTLSQTTIPLVAQDVIGGKTKRLLARDPILGKAASFRGTIAGDIEGKPVLGTFTWEPDAVAPTKNPPR